MSDSSKTRAIRINKQAINAREVDAEDIRVYLHQDLASELEQVSELRIARNSREKEESGLWLA